MRFHRTIVVVVVVAAIVAASASARSSGCYRACVSPAQVEQAKVAIRKVFGPYSSQALAVASCESGLSVRAYNGQYLGLFQMGSYARSAYGHHPTSPWVQARAAYRYFVASGKDWSPWSCQPW